MSLNLDKTYTVKSNATRDMKKAVAKGEYAADALEVVVVPTGYQIVVNEPVPEWVTDSSPIAIDPFAEAAELSKAVPAPKQLTYDPASIRQAVNLVNGETVSVANLHGPVRAVDGAPEKAARKAAAEAVAPLKAAREAAAVQVPATPAVAPAGSSALTPEQTRLLVALIDCKALADKPLHARVGVWVRYKALHDSETPHNLAKGQLPGLTGALRRKGMIELRGSSANGEVRLTAAALEA